MAGYDEPDLIVVGGGPGGCAAALMAAQRGLTVHLLHRDDAARYQPGETLPPALKPLFTQLGASEALTNASRARHSGHSVQWRGVDRAIEYGGDERGPWLGFQVCRNTLDRQLREVAIASGVSVTRAAVERPVTDRDGRVVGVIDQRGEHRARFVIDAAGARHWLARALGLTVERVSPRLVATYGRVTGALTAGSRTGLVSTTDGWEWIAEIGDGVVAWVRLTSASESRRRDPPSALSALTPVGATGRADVTWRRVPMCAGPGYALVGDASFVVDPSSSHGVLLAVMSGMMAADLIAACREGAAPEAVTAEGYRRWAGERFDADVAMLREVYGDMLPIGAS